jgi:hypothetical protein
MDHVVEAFKLDNKHYEIGSINSHKFSCYWPLSDKVIKNDIRESKLLIKELTSWNWYLILFFTNSYLKFDHKSI